MKKIYLLFLLSVFTAGLLPAQTICLDTLYKSSDMFGDTRDIAAIDWNHDGAMDYVFGNTDSNKVYIHLRNTSDRVFDPAALSTFANINDPNKIRTADFNNDTYMDIAVLYTGVGFDDSVKVFFSDGSGGILSVSNLDVPFAMFMEVADLNMDGSPDLVVSESVSGGSPNIIYTFRNLGSGSFITNASSSIPYSSIKGIRLADMDGDGDMDIFAGSSDSFFDGSGFIDTSKVFVIENTTTPLASTFSFSNQYSFMFPPDIEKRVSGICAGDFNGDGKADMAVSLDLSNKVAVFLNDGSNGYGTPVYFSAGNYPQAIDCGDMDNDGDMDIVTTLYYGAADQVFLNDAAGNFSAGLTHISLPYYTILHLVDMDNDGYKDLLKCSFVNNPTFDARPAVIYNNTNASASMTSYNGNILCAGAAGIFYVSSTHPGFQTGLSYAWQDASTNDSLIFNTTSPGVYTLNVTITNTSGCTVGAGVSVTVNALPADPNLGPDIDTCANSMMIGVPDDGVSSYIWSSNPPYLGSSNSMESVTVHSNAAVEYALTVIDGTTGCFSEDTVTVTLKETPNPSLGNDLIRCNFSPVTLSPGLDPNTDYSWTSNPAGFTSTSYTVNVTPGAATFYYVVATNSVTGCSNSDTISVYSNGSPSLTLTGSFMNHVCLGDSIRMGTLMTANGGTPPYSFNWFYGAGTLPNVPDPLYTPTSTATFSVGIVDANSCTQGFSTSVSVIVDGSNTDLRGHVTTPLPADVDNGLVYAFRYQPGAAGYDTLGAVPLDANGEYNFVSMDNGTYLIKAIADETDFPLLVPTYFGDAFQWDSSVVVNHGCTQIDTADIEMIEQSILTGPGVVSGYILEGDSFGVGARYNGHVGPIYPCVPGGPLKGIDVKLGKNPAGGIQARMMTDSTGKYEFTNLPLMGYKIYVDIPNLPMDSTREITLDATNNVSVQNNYYADSASVYIADTTVIPVGIYSSEKVYENNFTVFPNPAKDHLSLSFDLSKAGDVEIEISNAIGQSICSERINDAPAGNFVRPVDIRSLHLKAGVYFISVLNDNKKCTQRVVVME
ncbi:MAG: repeat/calx-beta domain protein [Bacteroidetes bacterium]|jgi:hypothetical protein|nr:repeat/calx-beta domain protein [Bacteroidota bacterium]